MPQELCIPNIDFSLLQKKRNVKKSMVNEILKIINRGNLREDNNLIEEKMSKDINRAPPLIKMKKSLPQRRHQNLNM